MDSESLPSTPSFERGSPVYSTSTGTNSGDGVAGRGLLRGTADMVLLHPFNLDTNSTALMASESMYCSNCKEMIMSEVTYESGKCTHYTALGLTCLSLLFCAIPCLCGLPCCPYCWTWFKKQVHCCPRCQTVLKKGYVYMQPQ